MNKEHVCFLCGLPAQWNDQLDQHHIFGGPFRKKSEQYGLVVFLHHYRCHLYGRNAVHVNRESMLYVKRFGQRKLMEGGWTLERFIQEFGKNYLEVEDNIKGG